jgi:hypothetical protein
MTGVALVEAKGGVVKLAELQGLRLSPALSDGRGRLNCVFDVSAKPRGPALGSLGSWSGLRVGLAITREPVVEHSNRVCNLDVHF